MAAPALTASTARRMSDCLERTTISTEGMWCFMALIASRKRAAPLASPRARKSRSTKRNSKRPFGNSLKKASRSPANWARQVGDKARLMPPAASWLWVAINIGVMVRPQACECL